MFGGHDTTGSALAWAIYNLANNPDMQEKCRKEVDEVIEGLKSGEDSLEWYSVEEVPILHQNPF